MRESVRTQDPSWSCRHSSRIMHLLECMFILEHCTALRCPLRAIPLLSISSPRRGNLSLQVQGACEGTARPRGRDFEESRSVALMMLHVLEFVYFNICCIRVKHLNS